MLGTAVVCDVQDREQSASIQLIDEVGARERGEHSKRFQSIEQLSLICFLSTAHLGKAYRPCQGTPPSQRRVSVSANQLSGSTGRGGLATAIWL